MNFLFECAPIDPATGVPKTYRFASLQAQSGSTLVDGKEWDAAINETPDISVVFYQAGLVQQSSIDYGSISLQLTAATANLTNMLWDGATGRVWVGVEGQPFSSYTKYFEGGLGAHSKDGDALKIPLYGLDFKLNETNILKSYYGGTGGVEGPASIKGTFKPRAYGSCRYVTPVRIDTANVVYQVHDGACQNISAVYENAMSLGSPAFTVSTYAQLIGLTLAPGTWARAPAVGMFRLANEPSGKFTADVVGDTAAGQTLASITTAILNGAGIASSDIDASVASVAGSIAWNTYITDQATVGDTIRKPFADAFLYLTTNEFGKLQAGSWLANGATINVGGPNATFNIIPQSLTLEEAAPSNYSITINAEKCWTVHDTQDISPAIADLQEGQQVNNDAATAAQNTANQAVANIVVEKARTDAILNDGIMDVSEKSERKLAYAGITTDYPRIIAQANVYNVPITAYANAYAALNTYLNSLSPAWNDLSQDTPIVRSTWDAAWEGERAARVAILRAIADATAKLANWPTVTGDGRPADNATVGAPAGTNVGGRPAETVITNIDQALAAVSTLNSAGYLDTIAPPIPTGLALSSTITDNGANLSITWTASTASDFDSYIIAIKEGSGNFVEFQTTAPNYQLSALPRFTAYTAKVSAVDKAGNKSGFSDPISATTARDTIPPAIPTGIVVTTTYNGAVLAWTNAADTDLKTVEIWRSTTNNSAAATKIDAVSVTPGQPGQKRVDGLTAATTYYFFLKSVDTSGNASAFTAAVTALTAGGIVAADFTPNVSPITTVTSLPTVAGYTGSSVVMFNGELYRLTNGAWSKSVSGGDIVSNTIPGSALVPTTALPATITVANVAGLNTIADAFKRADWSTVAGTGKPADNATVGAPTGTMVGSTLAQTLDSRVTSGLFYADTRADNQPPSFYYAQAGTVRSVAEFKTLSVLGITGGGTYGQMTTTVGYGDASGGPVQQEVRDSLGRYWNRISTSTTAWGAWSDTGAQINAGVTTISGGKITTGSVTALQIAASTITASQIAANTITSDQIAARSIVAADLVANTITANEIAARTIAAGNIVAGAITANELAANSITATQIAANTITASKLVLTSGGFINKDPSLSDATNWAFANTPSTFVTVTDAPVGSVVIRSGALTGTVYENAYHAIDPAKSYRFRFYARRSTDCNGVLYGDLRQFSAPGVATASNGGRAPYKPSAAVASTSWVEYSNVWGPSDWQAGVKFVQLDWLLNYGGSAGYMEICYPRFSEMASAELIVDGTITANKIAANTITSDQIAARSIVAADLVANTITANEIAANTITANQIAGATITANQLAANSVTANQIAANSITVSKLSVASRPISTFGVNLRVEANGSIVWDNGFVQYVATNGSYVSEYISAGNLGIPTAATYIYFVPGSAVLSSSTNESAVLNNPDYKHIATWSGGTTLAVAAGVGTILNGDRIVTGTINATKLIARTITSDKIAAGAITANEILAGTISAAQIAAGAITATKLAIGNSDSIIPDNSMIDPKFWFPTNPVGVSFSPTNAAWPMAPTNFLSITPGGAQTWTSPAFDAEVGATYRIRFSYFASSDFAGKVNPTILIPSSQYMSLKTGLSSDPTATDSNTVTTTTGSGTVVTKEIIYTNPSSADARRWNFRFDANITAGNFQCFVSIVRVSDTTLIADGAITTSKITVNSLNGDRITAGTLSADKITAGSVLSNTITVSGAGTLATAFTSATWAGVTGAGKPVDNATSDLQFVAAPGSTSAISIIGNSVTQTDTTTGWTNMTLTRTSFVGGATITGTLSTASAFLGLTVNAATSGASQFTSLNYAFHCSNATSWLIYEGANGISLGASANGVVFSSNTVFQITYDGVNVRYYADGVLMRTIAATQGLKFYGGVCLGGPACAVTKIGFVPFTDNSWTSVGGVNRPADNATVGAPSGTNVGSTPAQTVESRANNPAATINANSTTIDPGKILISGGTTLSNWRNGGDNTKIEGGSIAANTISANKITVGNRGVRVQGMDFSYNRNDGRLYWTAGRFMLIDNNGAPIETAVPAGNSPWQGGTYNYVWGYPLTGGQLYLGNDNWNNIVGDQTAILMCSWAGGVNFQANYGGTIIDGDRITTNSIQANKLNVGSLSAVSANIGLLRTATTGARTEIESNQIRVYDANNVLRVRMGVW